MSTSPLLSNKVSIMTSNSLQYSLISYHHASGWDRKYSIVSSVDREIAEACGLLDDSKYHVR